MPRVRGPQEFTLPQGATLKQLVEKGLSMSHAGVGTVVRLRKELSLVKDVPVLIAIDDVSLLYPHFGSRNSNSLFPIPFLHLSSLTCRLSKLSSRGTVIKLLTPVLLDSSSQVLILTFTSCLAFSVQQLVRPQRVWSESQETYTCSST